jgi:hypothetical protein
MWAASAALHREKGRNMGQLAGVTKTRGAKAVAASGALMVALTGLVGCGDSAGPESGEVTTEDLTELEEQVTALEDRVGAVEEGMGAEAPAGDGASEIVGEEVTVSAQVTELITSSDVGSAFRIAGDSGPTVAVLATSPPEGLEVDDVVQISGTVQMVNRDSFEEDFGIAEDDLFDDADAFFEESEGQLAIAASEIDVLQEQADS